MSQPSPTPATAATPPAAPAVTLRGSILRDTQSGTGLVAAQGRQLPFDLEMHWRSDRPPVVGAKVDLVLDADGRLQHVSLVDEAQMAKELAGDAARQLGAQGQQLWQQALREFGGVPLAAMGVLLLAWYGLDTFSVRLNGSQLQAHTLWEANKLLGGGLDALTALRGGGGSAGLWGLLLVAASLAPLLPLLWRDRRANLGLAAPLLFLGAEGLRAWSAVQAATDAIRQQAAGAGSAGAGFGLGREFSRYAAQMAEEMNRQLMQAISLGAGFYLGLAAALVLAAFALLRWQTR